MTTRKSGKAEGPHRSPCPLACTLDILGDKWSLLVVRDLLMGKRTYGELLESPEGIPTNILADRLKRLQENGLIVANPYQEHPVRYAYLLTKRGLDLGPILLAVANWGNRHISGTLRPPAAVPAPPSHKSGALRRSKRRA
jgi:DNA-binding HxlR family transcriptional regulator